MSGEGRARCEWAGTDPQMVAYHDEEWGVPLRDERALLELLTLEGAQAGLSWQTVLRRREGYRRAFLGFEAEAVAAFGDADIERLMGDTGIIRNRAKILSAIANARATIELRGDGAPGGLDALIRSVVGESVPLTTATTIWELPAETAASKALSRELKRHGFGFVGPTIIYAFLQSAGYVNDHVVGCFRRDEIKQSAGR
jgi:DNA-3-methyladenine glycosylase I